MSREIKTSTQLLRDESSVDLVDILRMLLINYRLILGTAFSFAFVAALVSFFFLKPIFESSAVITHAKSQGFASQLNPSGDSGILQLLNFGGAGQEITQYFELLKSNSLTRSVVEQADLVKKLGVVYDEAESNEEVAKIATSQDLQKDVKLILDGNFLRISYQHEDPAIAYLVVATYLNQLAEFIQKNINTNAKATEAFVEQRLLEAKDNLAGVERDYVSLKSSEGVVELGPQLGLSLNTASQLRSQLMEKEMEIELFKNVIRDSSEIQRLEAERAQIKAQLDRLIQGHKKKVAKGDIEIFTPLREGAALALEFANAERKYLTQVKIVDLLQQQLELARIDTKKQEPKVQVIDHPTEAVIPVGPNKKLIIAIAFTLGLILGSLIVIFLHHTQALPAQMYRVMKIDVNTMHREEKAVRKESI